MCDNNLSAKDEALLILEYLENEHMYKTFLNFLDENKHLNELRQQLYENYENNHQSIDDNDVKQFQTFFNLSKQILSQTTKTTSSDLFFDEEFLNNFISQTPPMDYQHNLPDTPISSNINSDTDELKSIEQLFAIQHQTPSQSSIQILPSDTPSSYTKCIVVTQDFLQSIYNPSSTITHNNNNINSIPRLKRRRRRLKKGKENYSQQQQRKLMPRTS